MLPVFYVFSIVQSAFRARGWEEVLGGEMEGVDTPDEPSRPDGPPQLVRRLTDQAVKVGTRTRLLVEIASSSPLTVVWLHDGKKVEEDERVKLVNEGNFYCADISPLTLEDEGTWTCQGQNARGLVVSHARLSLVVPRQYKAPEFVEPLRATLTSAGTVSLETKVVGIPTPSLRWYKDDVEIRPGDVLGLTPDPKDPSLGVYTCVAVNCMGRATSVSKVHVVSPDMPSHHLGLSTSGPKPIFAKELRNEKVKVGGTLNLECQVRVPPWPDRVSWYNSEGEVKEGPRAHLMEDGMGGYSIRVSPVHAADDGTWRFVATNRGGATSITTSTVAVSYPKNYRKPKFLDSLKAVLTEEGLVSFECKVVGYPTPLLSWFKDGQELKPGDVYQLTGTNSLGSYCCIARNCMGEASSTAVLTVEDIQSQLTEEERLQLFSEKLPPKFIQGLKSAEAKIMDPFTFTVKVSVSPEPTILWFRDDEHIEEGEPRYKLERDKLGLCSLHISRLEFVDQAEWKCVAMNDYGQSVTSSYLKLNIPRHYKKPKFLEELRAVLSDEGAVNLECKVIGVPQPVLKWFKDGKELKPGDIHRIISGQDGSCCLGTYTCMAQNCMGTVSSSASLLGFQDKSVVTPGKVVERTNTCLRDTSLSTIQEERTSQLHDTDKSLTIDERPEEVSFSFDGREVSVSLYETPDLTEEEALQIVEMYADQISEHVSEHNVVELPPMRFTKESSTSGKLLKEAIVIDVSPDYFTPAEPDDLRTDADIDEFSIAEETMVTPDEERAEMDFTSPERRRSGDSGLQRDRDRAVAATPREDQVQKAKKKSIDSEKEDDSLQEFERRKTEKRTFKERRRTESEIEDDSLYEFESRKAREQRKEQAKALTLQQGAEQDAEATKSLEKEEVSESVDVLKSLETNTAFKTADMGPRLSRESKRSLTEADLSYDTAEEPSVFEKSEMSVLESLAQSLHEIQRGLANVEAKAVSEAQVIKSPEVSVMESLAVPLADVQRSLELMEEKLDEGLIGHEVLETLVQPINEFKENLKKIEEEKAIQRRASSIIESLAKPLQELEKEIQLIQEQCAPRRYSSEERYAKTVEEVQETLTRIIERQESVPHDRKLMKTISVELQELEETATDDLEKYYDRLLSCGSEIRKKLMEEENQEVVDVLRSIADLVKPLKHLTAVTSKCISVIVKDYDTQGVPSARLVESLVKPLEALRSSLDLLENVSGLKSHRAIRGVGIPLLYKLSVPMDELETTIKLVENLSAHTAVEFLVPPLENLMKTVADIDISSGGEGFLEDLPVEGSLLLTSLENCMEGILSSMASIKVNVPKIESDKELIEKLPNIVKPLEDLKKSLKPIETGIVEELSYDDVCELAQNLSKPLQSLRSELSILQHEIEIEECSDLTGEKLSPLSSLIRPLEAVQNSISTFHESVLCKEDPIHLRFVLYALKEMEEPFRELSSKISMTEEAVRLGRISQDPVQSVKNVVRALRDLRETACLTKNDLPSVYKVSSLLNEPLEVFEATLANTLSTIHDSNKEERNVHLLKNVSEPLKNIEEVLNAIDAQAMLEENEGSELKATISELKESVKSIKDEISSDQDDQLTSFELHIGKLESLIHPLQVLRSQMSEIQRASVKSLIKTDRVLTEIRDASKNIASIISVSKESEGPLRGILESLESVVQELGEAAECQNIRIGQGMLLGAARQNMSETLAGVAATLGDTCAAAEDLSVGLEGERRTALILVQDMVHDLKSAVESTIEVMSEGGAGVERHLAAATALEQLKTAMTEFGHSISGIDDLQIPTPKKSVSMDELKDYVVQLERDVNLVIDKISTTVDKSVAQPVLNSVLSDVKCVKKVVLNMAEERNLDESRIQFVLEKVKCIEMDLQELSKDTLIEECSQLNEACKTAQAIVSMQDQLIQTSREDEGKTNSDIIENLVESVKSLESVVEKLSDESSPAIEKSEMAKISHNLFILQENILALSADDEEIQDFSSKLKDLIAPVRMIESALCKVHVDDEDLKEAVSAVNKIASTCEKACKGDVSRKTEFEQMFSVESLSTPIDTPIIRSITAKIEDLNSEIKPLQEKKGSTKLVWFVDSMEESVIRLGKLLAEDINALQDPGRKKELLDTIAVMKANLSEMKFSEVEKVEELTAAFSNLEKSLEEGPHKVLPALQQLLSPVLNLHESVVTTDVKSLKRAETKYLDNCFKASSDLELGLMRAEKAVISSEELDIAAITKPLQVLCNQIESISHDPNFEFIEEDSSIAQLQAMTTSIEEVKSYLSELEYIQATPIPGSKEQIEKLLVSLSKPVRELRQNIALVQEQALLSDVEGRTTELEDLKDAISVVCRHVEEEESLKSLVGPVQVLKETLEAACKDNLSPEEMEGPVRELKTALEHVESEAYSLAESSVSTTVAVPLIDLCHHVVEIIETRVMEAVAQDDTSLSDLATLASIEDVADDLVQATPISVDTQVCEGSDLVVKESQKLVKEMAESITSSKEVSDVDKAAMQSAEARDESSIGESAEKTSELPESLATPEKAGIEQSEKKDKAEILASKELSSLPEKKKKEEEETPAAEKKNKEEDKAATEKKKKEEEERAVAEKKKEEEAKSAAEKKKKEEEKAAAEKKKKEEEEKVPTEKKKKQEEEKAVEEKKKEEEEKPAAEKMKKEEEKAATEKKKIEEEEKAVTEKKKKDEEKASTEKKKNEEEKAAAEKNEKEEEEKAVAEKKKEEEEKPAAEKMKKEEEKAATEKKKKEEEEKAATEKKKKEEEKASTEKKKNEEEKDAAEKKKEEEEKAAAEKKKEEEEKATAEKKKKEEEKKAATEKKIEEEEKPAAEKRKKEEEENLAAEKKQKEEEKAAAEKKKDEEEKAKAEKKKKEEEEKAAAEYKQKEQEDKAAAEKKKKVEEDKTATEKKKKEEEEKAAAEKKQNEQDEKAAAEKEIPTPKKSVSMDELKDYVVQLERDVNLVIDKISTTVDKSVAQPVLNSVLSDVKCVKKVVLNMAEERNLDESRIQFVLEKVKFIEMDLQELAKALKEECSQLNEACKTAQAIVSMQHQLIQTSSEEEGKNKSDIIEKLSDESSPAIEKSEMAATEKKKKEEEKAAAENKKKEEEKAVAELKKKEEENAATGKKKKEAEDKAVAEKRKEEEEKPAAEKMKKEEEEEKAATGKKKKEDEEKAAVEKKKKEEEKATAETKKKEEEEKAAAEKKKKEQEDKAAAEKKKKEEEDKAVAEKRKEEEEKPAAEKMKKEIEEEKAATEKKKKEEEDKAVAEKRKEEEEKPAAEKMKKEEEEEKAATEKKKKEEEEKAATEKKKKEEEKAAGEIKKKEEEKAATGKKQNEEEEKAVAEKRKEEEEKSAAEKMKKEIEEEKAATEKKKKEEEEKAAAEKKMKEEEKAVSEKKQKEQEEKAAAEKVKKEEEEKAATKKKKKEEEEKAATEKKKKEEEKAATEKKKKEEEEKAATEKKKKEEEKAAGEIKKKEEEKAATGKKQNEEEEKAVAEKRKEEEEKSAAEKMKKEIEEEKAATEKKKKVEEERAAAEKKMKEEEKAVSEKKQKEQEEKAAAEKVKKEEEEKAATKKKKKEEEEKAAAEKKKKEEEEKATAEKKKEEEEKAATEKKKKEEQEKAAAEKKQKEQEEKADAEMKKKEEQEKAVVEKRKEEEEKAATEKKKKEEEEKAAAEKKKKEEEEEKATTEKKKEEEEKAVAEKKKEEEEKASAEKKQKEQEGKAAADMKKKEEEERAAAEKKKKEDEKAATEKKKKEDEEKAAVEKKKKEEEKATAEKKKKEEEEKAAAEKKKKEQEDKAAAEKKKKEEEEKAAAEKKKKEEEKVAAEKKKKEEEKAAAEKKKKEEEKAAAEKKKNVEEEKAAAEKKKEEEEKAAAEKKKEEEEKAAAEKKKKEEEKKAAAEKKKEEEEKAAAQKKNKEEEKAAAEKKKKEEEDKAAAEKKKKEEEEKAAAEKKKKEEEKAAAEKKKKEEEEKAAIEMKKKEEEEKAAAEKKKKEEEKAAAEKKKKEEEEKAAAEKKKKEEEKAATERKKKEEEEKAAAEKKKKEEEEKAATEKKKKEEEEKAAAEKKKKEEEEKAATEKKKKEEEEKAAAEKKKKEEEEKAATEMKKKEKEEKAAAEKKKKEEEEKAAAEKKKKEEEKAAAEKKKKEEEEKAAAEKKKKEEEKAAAEKKKKEEEEKAAAEKKKKEEEEKAAAEKKKKEEEKAAAEKKKKEEEEKAATEKKKKEEEEKAATEKKKNEEEEKAAAEKKKKEEEKAAAEKKKKEEEEKAAAEKKKKEEKMAATEKKKKEEEEKAAAEKKKKEEEENGATEKKKNEEEGKAAAEKKKKEEEKAAAEKKKKEEKMAATEKKKKEEEEKAAAEKKKKAEEKLAAGKKKKDVDEKGAADKKTKKNEKEMIVEGIDESPSNNEEDRFVAEKKKNGEFEKQKTEEVEKKKELALTSKSMTDQILSEVQLKQVLVEKNEVGEVRDGKEAKRTILSQNGKMEDQVLDSLSKSGKTTSEDFFLRETTKRREADGAGKGGWGRESADHGHYNGSYKSGSTESIDSNLLGKREYSATVESYVKYSQSPRKYLVEQEPAEKDETKQHASKLNQFLSRSGLDMSYEYSPQHYLVREDYSKKDFSSMRSAKSTDFITRHYTTEGSSSALDSLRRRVDRSWRDLSRQRVLDEALQQSEVRRSSERLGRRDASQELLVVPEDFSPLAQSRRYTRRRSASPLPSSFVSSHVSLESLVLRPKSRFDQLDRQPYICSGLRDKRVDHGANVKLTCNIGGEPEPTVQWRKDGQPIESIIDRFIMDYSFGVASLEIKNVIASDAGQYTCVATNSVGQAATTSTLRVNTDHWQGMDGYGLSSDIGLPLRIPEKSPRITGLIADTLVPAGGVIALHLQVDGCPRAEVTWLKEGSPLRYGSRMHTLFDQAMGLHTLLVEGATLTEGGLYHCKVFSGGFRLHEPAPAHIQVVERRPNDKPALITARPETRISLTAGEDLTLTCYVSGEPKPRVMFMKGLKDITEGSRTLKESFGEYTRLTLKRAMPEDSGTYFIVARNPYGTDRAFSTIKIRERTRSLTPTRREHSSWREGSYRESSVFSTSTSLSLNYL